MARSRRSDNDDEDRGSRRGGRGGGGRRGGDGGFGAMLLVGLLIFLGVAGGAVYLWNASRENDKAQVEALEAAYTEWLKSSQDHFRTRVNTIAAAMSPIYEDAPAEKSTPEFITTLSKKYGPTLTASGASYAWCKKSWSVKGQNYSANISPSNASQFMLMPQECYELGGSISLTAINGQANMSGAVSFYYDRQDDTPKAIVSLNLGPDPSKAAKDGEGPPKTVMPTSFTLWFSMPEPTGDAKRALYQKMHPKLEH